MKFQLDPKPDVVVIAAVLILPHL